MNKGWKLYLGDREFYYRVAAIAIPVSLQQLISIGVNMMDTIMLGNLGEIQLSASSLANQFINIFHCICMGLGMGASVLTSRYWGAKDIASLKKSATIMFRICIAISLVFTAATFAAPAGIMMMFSEEKTVIAAGIIYLLWSAPSYLLHGLSLTTTIVLRSMRKTGLPLLTSIGAFFVNIFFNWVFIFGKLGAPRMEIAGAALGTLIARVFEFAVICGYFFLVEKEIAYRIRDLFADCRDMIKEVIRVSLPVMISDSLLGFGNSAVSMVIGHLGASFTSANAITAVVVQLSTVFILGIANASGVITGNTLGEGKVKEAQAHGYTFWDMGLLIGVLGAGLIMLISEPVINFYNITDGTKKIARELMRAISFIVVFQAQNTTLTKGVLRGGGDTKFLMVVDIIFLWLVSIPLGAMAGLIWGFSPFWIYVCLKLDQVIKAVWCIFRLRSGKWIKKIKTLDELTSQV